MCCSNFQAGKASYFTLGRVIDAADGYVFNPREIKDFDLNHGRNSSSAICFTRIDHDLIPSLEGDSLKLRAEVTYMSLLVSPSDRLLVPKLEALSLEPFRQALKTLYGTSTGSDFVLVSSDGVEESVHRAILIARSPVFAAMFESNMTEVQTGRSVISDVSGPVLKALVEYMYCGCSGEDFGEDSMNVLLMADKYQLTELVNYCEQLLIRTVSKDNVTEILLLTDGVSVPALKKAALRFLSTHTDDLSDLKKSGAIKKLGNSAAEGQVGTCRTNRTKLCYLGNNNSRFMHLENKFSKSVLCRKVPITLRTRVVRKPNPGSSLRSHRRYTV